ncbi:DUF1801 domain-containing protein [Petrimonas mucosa]|jgi:hypothetical protein|uniref:YdhG-like domain-containing protein n=1 Tax=Petrimonas mucosa TaxID=1642646 RepID=A0A1G4GA76_9BACT|nr:DUF1801 domain-containing protein [Petrimonas mucosa]SCM59398.1 putative protein {ECO:0000313/EMBL:AFL84761,1} [Petrimonas mucosa]
MAELKTREHDGDVAHFIRNHADTEQKLDDSFALLELMREATGYEPKMWGDSIIGFGKYHYKSERSRQEGDWMLVGFSPRKAAISLYVYAGTPEQEQLLARLGKFKMGKGCIYVKRLSDIDPDLLRKIIRSTVSFLEETYGKQ